MNIGKNIKQMRESLGMEQQELAEKLNISNKTISSWECGRTEPKMGMIEAMCKVFNCSKTRLIDGDLEEPKPFGDDNKIIDLRGMKLTDDDIEYIRKFVELKPDVKEKLIQMIDILHEKGEKQ